MHTLRICGLLLLGCAAFSAIEDADTRVPQRIPTIGTFAYFPGTTATEGTELWRTDGTVSGTTLVRDIVPGTSGSGPKYLLALGSSVYFSANDGSSGRELWVSDGTAPGTHLVLDISPGAASSNPHHLTVAGGRVFFAAFTPGIGWRLWATDGTTVGTVPLADPLPSTTSDEFDYNWHHSFCGANTLLFFDATDTVGNRLWVSDGTPVGTHAVLPAAGPGNNPIALGSIGDVCFYASVSDGSQLWSSDGTQAGTARMPGNIAAADFSTGINGHIFTRGTTGAYTNGIYVSDATLGTPTLVSSAVSAPSYFWNVNGLAFTDVDVPGAPSRRLVVSDGTSAGTSIVSSTAATFGLHMPVGNQLYFTSETAGVRELWRTDGTSTGTVLATAIIADPVPVGSVNGKALATTLSDWTTYQLMWSTDGTTVGTVQIMPPPSATASTSGSGTTGTGSASSGGTTGSPIPVQDGDGKNFICGLGSAGAIGSILMFILVRSKRL